MYINKKKIVCIVLCIWIVFMAVGFAIFQEQLTITGTSHVDSRWEIKITNISTSDIVGDATEKTAPSYTDTTARLKVSLINPTDSITYNVTVKNNGTLDARIKKINVDTGDSDAIEFEVTCKLNDGTYDECNDTNFKNLVLEPNDEQMLKIKITFKAGYIGDPSISDKTSTVKLTIDYVQNFEDSNGNQILPPEDRAYSIGDVVEFAGSNWYVIEDSPSSQDYITLLKQNPLTENDIPSEYTVLVDGKKSSGMAYYWSSTCHYGNNYTYVNITYDSLVHSGCSGHADYTGSKIREILENSYLLNLGTFNLKEVDGYRIRLITKEDLIVNLGYVNDNKTMDTPNWVYGTSYYWTMTPYNSTNIWVIRPNGSLTNGGDVSNATRSIRPVINLYKSAIE